MQLDQTILYTLCKHDKLINTIVDYTWPAMARPSASIEDVNQTCKQIWNAAIGVVPSRAAIAAARVWQNVTAMVLASINPPSFLCAKT